MISIIIPVYNAEQYLGRCIDSVLISPCTDYEIILINDGSTDQSPVICSQYAEKDRRIRLITQENQGVSAARNRGIGEAKGNWIIFLDADDVISDDFLSIVAQPEYQEQDIILFQFTAVHTLDMSAVSPDSKPIQNAENEAPYYQYDQMLPFLQRILVPQPLAGNCALDYRTPCARAYKKEILDRYSIRFCPEIKIGEDLLFNLEYQLKAKSCVFLPRTVYFYCIHEDSSSHRFHPSLRRNHACLLQAVRNVLDENDMFPELEQYYYSYALENLTYVLIREVFSPYSPRRYKENREICRKMQQNQMYAEALKHNRKSGILPRRVLVFFFRLKCWPFVHLISRISFAYLERK